MTRGAAAASARAPPISGARGVERGGVTKKRVPDALLKRGRKGLGRKCCKRCKQCAVCGRCWVTWIDSEDKYLCHLHDPSEMARRAKRKARRAARATEAARLEERHDGGLSAPAQQEAQVNRAVARRPGEGLAYWARLEAERAACAGVEPEVR